MNDSNIEIFLRNTQLESNNESKTYFYGIDSISEYNVYSKKMSSIYKKRLQIEKLLALDGLPFQINGFNNILGEITKYHVDFLYSYYEYEGVLFPNWRERLICTKTNLNNRQRATIDFLVSIFDKNKISNLNIYVTEQTTPYFNFLKNINKNIIGSEFLGYDIQPGIYMNNIRHEDVTSLSFSSAELDLIISNDVLEHVPNYKKSLKEFYRILKSNGKFIITVPFDLRNYEHLVRAKIDENNEVVHILPPEYHGDPINPEKGILCFQIFGWKLLDELKEVGFKNVKNYFYWSLLNGYLGKEQMLIYGEK